MLAANVRYYFWKEINAVPQDTAGVYAWYFSPEIPEYDIDFLVDSLERMMNSPTEQRHQLVRDFLDQHIFRFFLETPFRVELMGPLKPAYSGTASHKTAISQGLVERLAQDPSRFRTIKSVLLNTVPFLASPLYIGMAKDIGRRLRQHKRLIEAYRDNRLNRPQISSFSENETERDHGFAKEIAERAIPPSRLIVAVIGLPNSANCLDEHVDIENILNRIHFPLFGRN